MLTKDRIYVLHLLRKSLGVASKDDVFEGISAKAAEDAVIKNGIILTVYSELPQNMKKDLEETYYKTVKQSVLQRYETDRILKATGDAGYKCMALKGFELSKLYPGGVKRQMADIDILVKPYEFKKIKKIMKELGYGSEAESSWMHDNFRQNEINVEMHKRLTDDSGVIREWEEAVWDRAVQKDGGIYEMSIEDVYIYHYIHLYKDFKNGSLGLRRVVDGWLLQKQEYDREFVKNELKKIGLTVFHDKMVGLCRACMGETPIDADQKILLDHAFEYGINGSDRSYKAGRIASMSGKSMKSGKFKSFISAVFLPYNRMKAQFPVLYKWPVLLPFCRLKRIFSLVKNAKYNISRLDYSNIDNDDYTEMKEFFRAGGVG